MFSNTGPTLGIFLCFILFGDQGLYLASWYITLYVPFYYFVGFPLMSDLSGEGDSRLRDAFLDLVRNPVSIVPISSMCIGLGLNLAGVSRPVLLNLLVTKFLAYLLTASFSFAIGLGLNFRRSLKYVRHSLWISLIKFVYRLLSDVHYTAPAGCVGGVFHALGHTCGCAVKDIQTQRGPGQCRVDIDHPVDRAGYPGHLLHTGLSVIALRMVCN
jgi:predicted permease